MPYDDGQDSGSVDSQESDQGYKSFWLPPEAVEELPPDLKSGDIVKFKVVGKDSKGNVEVVCEHGEDEGDNLHADLERSMPASMGGTYGEANE